MNKKISVALLGSRMHYAVPEIFYDAGILDKFYTDFDSRKSFYPFFRRIPYNLQPDFIKKLNSRIPSKIPEEKVVAFNNFGIMYALKRRMFKNQSDYYKTILWAAKEFNRLIIKNLNEEAVYTFNGASLDLMKTAKRRGIRVYLEQTIAPKKTETELISAEKEKFPDWVNENEDTVELNEFIQREEEEWDLADKIVCGSVFVKNSISSLNGPVEKCEVVPYGIRVGNGKIRHKSLNEKINILTAGEVGLRKGSQYVYEIAKRLKNKFNFRMVGTINIPVGKAKKISEVVELTGVVPKSEMKKHYEWADIFILPSICEGSATVTYEALASGLPVLCSPNTGSVVEDGKDGFILAYNNISEWIEKLECFADNPDLLSELSGNALMNKNKYSYESYSERLLNSVA